MTDSRVIAFLTQIGFKDYVDKFADERIDYDTLLILKEGAIRQLVPIVGHQAKLENEILKLNESIASKRNVSLESDVPATGSLLLDSDVTTSNCKLTTRPTLDSSDPNSPHSKRCLKFESPTLKKRCLGASALKLNLKEVLNNTSTGSALLSFYNKNGLDPSHRQSLVQIVIDEAMRQSTSLKEIDFVKLTDCITELFSREKPETYFIRSCETNRGRQASGRLVVRYRNRRTKLILEGVLTPDVQENLSDSNINEIDTNEEIQNSSLWLKSNVFPWPEVLVKWEATSLHRLNIWRKEKKSFLELRKEYPALVHPDGFNLINIDFKRRYPGKGSLADVWDRISSDLLKLIERRFQKENSLMLLLQSLSNSESKYLMTLVLLHKLPPTMIITHGKRWHPTSVDSQDSFIIHIKDTAQIDEFINKLKSERADKKLSLQPFCLAIGPTLTEIKYYINYVEGVMFKFANVIEAIDSLFKTFMVFDFEYPVQSKLVWLFIQQYCYGIFTKHDDSNKKKKKSVVYNSSISALISDLQ